jgi:hypothetical protein
MSIGIKAESIEWFIEDQVLSSSNDLGSSPSPPFPPSRPVSKLSLFLSLSVSVSPVELTDRSERREGLGEEPNHATARSLVLYESFNSLWSKGRGLPFFVVVLFGYTTTPPPTYHGPCGSIPMLSLTFSSLCVMGRVCLSELTGGGGGGFQQKKIIF